MSGVRVFSLTLTTRWMTQVGLGLCLLWGGLVGTVWADGPRDHERARRAVESGEVMPLRTLLDRLEQQYPGQVMEVELERAHGDWVYEVKMLRKEGTLVKLVVNARDGSVIRVRERFRQGPGPGGHREDER